MTSSGFSKIVGWPSVPLIMVSLIIFRWHFASCDQLVVKRNATIGSLYKGINPRVRVRHMTFTQTTGGYCTVFVEGQAYDENAFWRRRSSEEKSYFCCPLPRWEFDIGVARCLNFTNLSPICVTGHELRWTITQNLQTCCFQYCPSNDKVWNFAPCLFDSNFKEI